MAPPIGFPQLKILKVSGYGDNLMFSEVKMMKACAVCPPRPLRG